VIRPYAKKPMHGRESDNRISFNIFDVVTQTYANKYYAFADAMLSVELHKGNGHRVRFSSDPSSLNFWRGLKALKCPNLRAKSAVLPSQCCHLDQVVESRDACASQHSHVAVRRRWRRCCYLSD